MLKLCQKDSSLWYQVTCNEVMNDSTHNEGGYDIDSTHNEEGVIVIAHTMKGGMILIAHTMRGV